MTEDERNLELEALLLESFHVGLKDNENEEESKAQHRRVISQNTQVIKLKSNTGQVKQSSLRHAASNTYNMVGVKKIIEPVKLDNIE